MEKAEKNKKRITQRPADLLVKNLPIIKMIYQSSAKKLEINDLSSSEENVLTFILIPYGSEKLFKSLNS